jgi:hypothetical protein
MKQNIRAEIDDDNITATVVCKSTNHKQLNPSEENMRDPRKSYSSGLIYQYVKCKIKFTFI